MIRCSNCSGKVRRGDGNCPACGEAVSPSQAGGKPSPKAYRRINDRRRWIVGTSIGSTLLFATVIAILNRAEILWERHEAHQEREAAIDGNSIRIAPGEMFLQEVVTTEAEGYTLTVMPYDAPCKAAFVRLGAADDRRPRDAAARALKGEAVEIDKKRSRLIEGTTGVGRHAWGVWHEKEFPVRVLILYQDTRGRKQPVRGGGPCPQIKSRIRSLAQAMSIGPWAIAGDAAPSGQCPWPIAPCLNTRMHNTY